MGEVKTKPTSTYHIRKLAKSGNSRYLSVGKLVPADWVVVKVFVSRQASGHIHLFLEQIK